MPSTISESDRQRLADIVSEIASEYEGQGYEVKLQPTPADLPDFLKDFRPDLIATGKNETVVVEVKTRDGLRNAHSVAALESALRDRPGWRFELIIEGSVAEGPEGFGADQIRASLDEADELQKHNHFAAALLLLWSGTEGALRQLAKRENVELESLASGYVLNRLYTVGLLARDQYQVLHKTMQLRDQAAHGFQVTITSYDLAQTSAALRKLLSEVEVKAA